MRSRILSSQVLLATCIVLLLAAVSLTVTLIVAQKDAEKRVMHTLLVEDELSRSRILMLRAEVFKRGFVMGGRSELQTRARSLQAQVGPALARIAELTEDNPDQRRRIRELQRLYLERVRTSQAILAFAAQGKDREASKVALSPSNFARQERWTKLIEAADAAERSLLAERQRRAQKLERPLAIAIGTAGLILVGLVCLFAADRRRKLVQLAELNKQLERDIERRDQLELELISARNSAEAATKAKANFLANMSHEIRTPMNGVLGFTDLMLSGRLDPKQRRHAQLVADSGKAMMRLLNDILDLSKIEAGQMQIAPEHVDLRHKVQNCVKLLKPAAEQKHLELWSHIDASVPEYALVDGLRLRQIILNLVGNAVKFTQEGSVIVSARLHHDDAGDVLHVQVADTGIGILAEKHATVFQEFMQADDTTAARFGGTGLGLAISKKLAEMMGGSLEFKSEPGRGTTFTLRVPVVPASSRPSEQAEFDESRGLPVEAVHILLAEDHDVNQELMQAMLHHLGHTVTIVQNGAEALDAVNSYTAEARPFDLVLMDMQMPVMDGISATRAIRGAGVDAQRLPILALTANAYADDVAECLAAGMQAHIAKPVQLQQLSRAIEKWTAKEVAAASASAIFISPALQARYDARKHDLRAFAEKLSLNCTFDNDAIEQLRSLLHKLAGSAGMFQEPELGSQAQEFELALEEASIEARPAIIEKVLAMPLAA